MITYLLYVIAALYLGVLTSISPCPLATNIAAISYIGRKVENPRAVIHAGLLYTLGRCLLYLALAGLLTTTALSIPSVSLFLQKYMHLALGPIFLLLGMFLVGLITMTAGGTMMSQKMPGFSIGRMATAVLQNWCRFLAADGTYPIARHATEQSRGIARRNSPTSC